MRSAATVESTSTMEASHAAAARESAARAAAYKSSAHATSTKAAAVKAGAATANKSTATVESASAIAASVKSASVIPTPIVSAPVKSAMPIKPATKPRTCTDKYAANKPIRPVEAIRRAIVRIIVVIAICADRSLAVCVRWSIAICWAVSNTHRYSLRAGLTCAKQANTKHQTSYRCNLENSHFRDLPSRSAATSRPNSGLRAPAVPEACTQFNPGPA